MCIKIYPVDSLFNLPGLPVKLDWVQFLMFSFIITWLDACDSRLNSGSVVNNNHPARMMASAITINKTLFFIQNTSLGDTGTFSCV